MEIMSEEKRKKIKESESGISHQCCTPGCLAGFSLEGILSLVKIINSHACLARKNYIVQLVRLHLRLLVFAFLSNQEIFVRLSVRLSLLAL